MIISPPKFSFKGDRNKAISLKAQARQFYNFIANQAELGGLSFLSRSVVLSDGSVITAMSKQNSIYSIRSGFIVINTAPSKTLLKEANYYLESGFLDHVSIAIGNQNTYKPSIIRFNSSVANNSQALVNASFDRTVSDGDESLAVGCNNKFTEINVSSNDTSYIFTSDIASFCVPDIIRNKKICQTMAPPSVYTGKLRLMVQSLYGSTRDDYEVDTNNGSYSPKILLNSYSLQHSGLESVGLYTDPNGEYWFVTMGSSQIIFYKTTSDDIDPSPFLDQSLKEDLNYIEMSEAYKLSTLKITDSPLIVNTSELSYELIGYFGPLAYGWKFNRDGSKASIVVYGTQTGIASNVWPAGTATTATGIKTKLITVTFGFDAELQQPKVVSVESVETGIHLPFTQVKVLYPVVVLGQYKMASLMVDYGSLGKIGSYQAPIYCYYNKLDQLEIVRVKNGGFSTAGTSDTRPSDCDSSKTIVSYMQPQVGRSSPTRTIWGDSGVSVGATNYVRGVSTSTGQTRNLKIQLTEDQNGWTEFSAFLFPVGTTQRRRYHAPAIGPSRWETFCSELSENYMGILVVPFLDAESILVGFDDRKDGNSYGALQYTFGNGSKEYEQEYWTVINDPILGVQWGSYVGTGYPNWYGCGFDWSQNTLTTDEAYAVVQAQSDIAPKREQKLYLHSGRLPAPEKVYDELAVLKPLDPRPVQALTPLLEISALSPFYDAPIDVKGSYSGSFKYAVIGSIGGDINWPTPTDWYTPVGWA